MDKKLVIDGRVVILQREREGEKGLAVLREVCEGAPRGEKHHLAVFEFEKCLAVTEGRVAMYHGGMESLVVLQGETEGDKNLVAVEGRMEGNPAEYGVAQWEKHLAGS